MTDKEETWEEYRKRVYGLTTEEKGKKVVCAHCGTDKDVTMFQGEYVCSDCLDALHDVAYV